MPIDAANATRTVRAFFDQRFERDRLKEVKGIGTPATRDGIIAKLLQDTFGVRKDGTPNKLTPMVRKEKKALVPTDFGRTLIKNVAESLTKPDLTATMEMALSEIAEGKRDPAEYMKQVEEMVKDNIRFAEARQYEDIKRTAPSVAYSCPVCGKPLAQLYSRVKGKHFWICKGCCWIQFNNIICTSFFAAYICHCKKIQR